MLEVDNVSVFYDGVRALEGVTLEEDSGEIVALIGANGAGKTTLLNLISGIVRPVSGCIRFDGEDISRRSPEEIVGLGIIHVPEGRHLFGPLTVDENLELGAYRRRKGKKRKEIAADIEDVFQLFPVLKKRRRQEAGTLSGGEQQMLAIGRGLMARPRLLLLDEPSLGLAPLLVQEILVTIRRLNETGTTVLLVEQNARAALRLCHRGYVMETGHIRMQGHASELLGNDDIRKAYLGGDVRNGCGRLPG